MGLLDMIIGWLFVHPNMGSVVDHSSQGRLFSFPPCSVVQHSSQGRFCFFSGISQKLSSLVKNNLDQMF